MKTASIILIIVGIVLLSIGSLTVLGVKLQILDTTPPTIIYTYPQNNNTYLSNEINEYVVYARDTETKVKSATYYDNRTTVNLELTPYTTIKHPMTLIIGSVIFTYPDVNFDGYVDQTDLDLVSNFISTNTYNLAYDLNHDGVIDIKDLLGVSRLYGTASFSSNLASTYTPGSIVNFAFSVVNNIGLSSVYSGNFVIEDYTLLSGTWKINDVIVNSTIRMEIESSEITVMFIKDSSVTIPDSEIKVTATVNDVTYLIPNINTGTWQSKITLISNENFIKLEAISTTAKNTATLTVIIPTTQLPLGYIMIGLGVLCFVGGVINETRKETTLY